MLNFKKATNIYIRVQLRDRTSCYFPEEEILVTANVVGMQPSIFHTESLKVLRKQYDRFLCKKAYIKDILKTVEFVLENNFLSLISSYPTDIWNI